VIHFNGWKVAPLFCIFVCKIFRYNPFECYETMPPVHFDGDAFKVGKAQEAIREAYKLALSLQAKGVYDELSKLITMEKIKTCKWFPVCPMKFYWEAGKLDDKYIKDFCHGDWLSCVRYQKKKRVSFILTIYFLVDR